VAQQERGRDAPVVVVTGAGSGIGAALARASSARGGRVVVADVDSSAARAVAAEIGGEAFVCDVSDASQVEALARFTLDRFGRVDDLYNNAGVGSGGPIDRMTADDWRWMLGVNLHGVIHGISAFLPLLRRNPDGGRIVNTASMSAVSPLPGLGAYAAAKSAVLALSEALSAELAQAGEPISVSVVLAGPVRTNINTSARHRNADGVHGLVDGELSGPIVDHMIDPDEAARRILAGVDAGLLFIATHPALAFRPRERFDAILRAFSPVAADPAASTH